MLTNIFFSIDSIDGEGRVFLTNRGLHIPDCTKCGIASQDGKIYFLLRDSEGNSRIKWRSIADKKTQGFERNPTCEKTPLFNATNIDAESTHRLAKSIIVTEGEFDCVAMIQSGAKHCVSLPNGASSAALAFRNHASYFQQFDEIFIAFDMDEPGEKAAKDVMALIPKKKYRRVQFPKGSKDANAWILNESPTFEEFMDLLNRSTKYVSPEIVSWSDLPESIFKKLDYGASSGWVNFDKLIGGFRPGEITVVTADTGSGKTTFCLNLMVNFAKKDLPVWINSYEMKPEVIFRKICSQFLGENMKLHDFCESKKSSMKPIMSKYPIYINPSQSSAELCSIRKQLELCSSVYGIKFVMLDHLDYINAGAKKSSPMERIDECMIELHKMAAEFDVHILLVVHPKQTADAKTQIDMSQLKGSASIKQYSDNILILQKMSRGNTSQDDRTKISVCKNRLFGTEGYFFLSYVSKSDSYSEA